ncbi:uncharacterized protein EDB91DRAFT_1309983 [Suillus paluster]|uniref:uncharacterized protein n=1 Tax=Suillus paluster TaxID=48578 RepID=UPI001B87E7B0|nr:uncharacterized protein EDB91DRAFT_1309983 [Suillus paluster]KAG1730560.1 hypothetical protein EDB91DRAFT_1309983 [Suillus paluster]
MSLPSTLLMKSIEIFHEIEVTVDTVDRSRSWGRDRQELGQGRNTAGAGGDSHQILEDRQWEEEDQEEIAKAWSRICQQQSKFSIKIHIPYGEHLVLQGQDHFAVHVVQEASQDYVDFSQHDVQQTGLVEGKSESNKVGVCGWSKKSEPPEVRIASGNRRMTVLKTTNAVRDIIPGDRKATVSNCQIEHPSQTQRKKASRQPNLCTVVLSEVPAKADSNRQTPVKTGSQGGQSLTTAEDARKTPRTFVLYTQFPPFLRGIWAQKQTTNTPHKPALQKGPGGSRGVQGSKGGPREVQIVQNAVQNTAEKRKSLIFFEFFKLFWYLNK